MPAPAVTKPAAPRRRFPAQAEAIGSGRMSFPSFLAMELVEVHCPEIYRRHSAQAH